MIHPYIGMACLTPDDTEARIVAVGPSGTLNQYSLVAVVLLPDGTHEEFDLVDLDIPDAGAAFAALRHFWGAMAQMVRSMTATHPVGWRVKGDSREALSDVQNGERHSMYPQWRATVEGWIRDDGLWLTGAFNRYQVADHNCAIVMTGEYAPALPDVSVVMALIDEKFPCPK